MMFFTAYVDEETLDLVEDKEVIQYQRQDNINYRVLQLATLRLGSLSICFQSSPLIYLYPTKMLIGSHGLLG